MPGLPKTYSQVGPVARTLELLGERWTILILQDLLKGYHRFNDLMKSVEGIASNVLSGRLKLLEENGVVERKFYNDHPPRAEYYLTKKGHELGVVAGAMAAWGARYFADETILIHTECHTPMEVVYYCIKCERRAKGSEVRLDDRLGSLRSII